MARNTRARSRADLKRSKAKRPPYDRLLIVCEGEKTEPNYLGEIRQAARISSVDVKIIHSPLGTQPQQIVEAAEAAFIEKPEYDRVYAVFDRDDHPTYANAIAMAEARNGRLRNDEGKKVLFEAVVSVPSFELWLLLHFVDIQAWLHRRDALRRLKEFLPRYEKGTEGVYRDTLERLQTAIDRATALKDRFRRLPGEDAYTDVHELVDTLRKLRD